MSEARTDFECLRAFSRQGDQQAFADVSRRHLDLVYATARRTVTDDSAVEEICQNVFLALGRKAWRLTPADSLPSWLHRTTVLEARAWLRGEMRRRRRDQTAAELGTTMKPPNEEPTLQALIPLLDEALLSLREPDRDALLLRYYESQSLRDVGASLGTSEDAARKRVGVALEKLTTFFQRHGFKTATVAVSTIALEQTAAAAPVATVNAVMGAALQTAPSAFTGLTTVLSKYGGSLLFSKTVAGLAVVAALLAWLWYQQTKTDEESLTALPNLEAAQTPPPPSRASLAQLGLLMADTIPLLNIPTNVLIPPFAGDIIGRVTLVGNPPPERQVDLKPFPELAAKHVNGLRSRHYLVGANHGLQNVLVYLKGDFAGRAFDPPRTPAVLEHVDGLFQPYVLGIQTGQELELRNTDRCVFHAVATANREFSYAGVAACRFTNAEVPVRMNCNLHPWNFAYVGVFAHPFFTTTDKDGMFKIAGVPPGRYTLEVFHPTAGRSAKEIVVSRQQTLTDFALTPKYRE